jgi:uncharacterized protein YegP (UPF0339 family)
MRGTKEFYLDHEEGWRWRTRAANGRITAGSGEGYAKLSDCIHGMWVTFWILLLGRKKVLG